MGTGSIAYLLNGTTRKRFAGWGQLFDNGGCGYTLGRDAITAALCEIDGTGEKTIITELMKVKIGESTDKHLTRFYEGGKRYIASFADLVFKAADLKDKVALKILENNMTFVSNLINTALSETEEDLPILISGGISSKEKLLFPLIEKHLKRKVKLKRIKSEPIEGAIKRAKQIYEEKRKNLC